MEQNIVVLNTILDEIKNIKTEMNDIKTNMLTKEDTKNFLTKEDAKIFATKEDLKAFATKEDLKKCATKDDVKMIMKEIREIKYVINGLAEDIAMLDLRTRSLVVYK